MSSLEGQGWVFVVSLFIALWGSLGVVRVLQDSVNSIWGVPRYRRPHFLYKLLRGFTVIVLLGVGVVGTAVVAAVTLWVDLPVLATVGAAVANIALAAGITICLYHLVIGCGCRPVSCCPGRR